MIQPFSGLAEDLILSLLAVRGENVLAFARPMRRCRSKVRPDPERRFRRYCRPTASVFISAVNGWRPSVICPACWRGLGPLALMKSDDPRLRIKGASSGLLTHCGVSDGLRSSRRVVHHVVVALAKLLSLRSPFECVAPDWAQALA